jgi:putative membrane protein
MTTTQVFVLGAIAALALVGAGASAAPPPLGAPAVLGSDKTTIQKLHDGDQLAIEMGKLAEDKGSTRQTRDYGRRLVTDHTAAERKLEGYLRKRGVDLSALPPTARSDADHEMLATKSGLEFDRAFSQQVIRDHQVAIELLDSARVETADDALRLFYDELLTTESAHKRAAEELLAASARSS